MILKPIRLVALDEQCEKIDLPAARSPTKLEERSKEVNASQCEVSDGRDIGSSDWRVKSNVKPYDKHGTTLSY